MRTNIRMRDHVLQALTIQNGVIKDPQYEYDVHLFFKQKILRVLLLLPGINVESLEVRTQGSTLEIKTYVRSKYLQIFKAGMLKLRYELPEPVVPNVVVTSYDDGILSLDLVREAFVSPKGDHHR